MSGLYEAILTAVDEPYEIWAPSNAAGRLGVLRIALKAVVERHKPEPCQYFTCQHPAEHVTCKACGRAVNHPCDELLLIAEKLGINEGEEITDE